eukprot:gene4378-5122_t
MRLNVNAAYTAALYNTCVAVSVVIDDFETVGPTITSVQVGNVLDAQFQQDIPSSTLIIDVTSVLLAVNNVDVTIKICTVDGGTIVINGRHLTPNGTSLNLDGKAFPVTTVTPGLSLSCLIDGSNAGVNLPLSVTNTFASVVNMGASLSFSYAAPTVTSFSSDSTSLTFVGTNFGPKTSFVTMTIDTFSVTVNTLSSHNSITTDIPSSIAFAGTKQMSLSVRNNPMLAPYTFVLKPIIDTVTSSSTGTITISGSFLTVSSPTSPTLSVEIEIGGFNCTSPTNPIKGTIRCSVSGTGSNLPVSVTINGVTSNIDKTFSFDSPIIESYEQNDDILILKGINFHSSNTVNISGISVTPKTVSDNFKKMEVTLPSDALNGYIQINSATSSESNKLDLTITPLVTSITNSPTVGGSVTMVGSFLNTKDVFGESLNVTFASDNLTCSDFKSLNHSAMSCDISPGQGANISVTLSIESLVSDKVPFSFDAPVITSYTQQKYIILLHGSNFGKETSLVSLDLVGNGTRVSDITANDLDNHTVAAFTMSDETDTNPNVTMNVAGQLSNEFSIHLSPRVEAVSHTGTQGGIVTIYGYFLGIYGGNPKIRLDVNITIGNMSCVVQSNYTSNDTKSIECLIGPGCGANHTVHIRIGDLTNDDDTPFEFSYHKPTISTITEVTEQGGIVTIKGTNFYNPVIVEIGGQPCKDAYTNDTETITCHMDAWNSTFGDIPQSQLDVNVTVDGQSDFKKIFKYDLVAVIAIPVTVMVVRHRKRFKGDKAEYVDDEEYIDPRLIE